MNAILQLALRLRDLLCIAEKFHHQGEAEAEYLQALRQLRDLCDQELYGMQGKSAGYVAEKWRSGA